jgi:hypothetical protein
VGSIISQKTPLIAGVKLSSCSLFLSSSLGSQKTSRVSDLFYLCSFATTVNFWLEGEGFIRTGFLIFHRAENIQSSAEEENDDSIDTFIDTIASPVKGNILEDYFIGQLVNSNDTYICQ